MKGTLVSGCKAQQKVDLHKVLKVKLNANHRENVFVFFNLKTVVVVIVAAKLVQETPNDPNRG